MNPFQLWCDCVKCGTADWHSVLHCQAYGRTPEYMRRVCTRCKYTWKEAPIDAGDQSTPPQHSTLPKAI